MAKRRREPKDAELWAQAAGISDLLELNARYIAGEIRCHPAYHAPEVDEETRPLINHLVAFNRAGFLTLCSQPGLIDDSEGEARVYKQRAFVDGFASVYVAAHLADLERSSDLLVAWYRPGDQGGRRIVVTDDGGRPFTFTGDATGLRDIEHFEPPRISEEAFGWLGRLCHVSIIDMQWGREAYLWDNVLAHLAGTGDCHCWRCEFWRKRDASAPDTGLLAG